MTPLLCPVWCAASLLSASSTITERTPCSVSRSAVASPTMPPPTMAMSQEFDGEAECVGESMPMKVSMTLPIGAAACSATR